MDELERLIDLANSEGDTVIIDDFPENSSLSKHTYIGLDRNLPPREAQVHLATQIGYCRNGDFYNCHSSAVVRGQSSARATRAAFYMTVPPEKIQEAVDAGCTETYEIAEYLGYPPEWVYRACFFYRNGYLLSPAS